MELRITNFANIINTTINLLDDATSVVVMNMSATGKTTIAKILYAFLSGEGVRGELVTKGAEYGEAELVLGGRRFRLRIPSKEGQATVERVIEKDYAQYLVLTEVGPMYAFYAQPDKFKVEVVVDKVVKRPSTKEIDEELSRLEQYGITSEVTKDYEEALKKYERELQEVEARLREVSEKIESASKSERLEILIKKQKILEDIAGVERQISHYDEEVKKITAELASVNYEELKLKRKKLGEEVERLEKLKLRLTSAQDALKDAAAAFRRLEPVADVLYDMNVHLFGNPVDPSTVSSIASECEMTVANIASKIAEVDARLSTVKQELSTVNMRITHLNERLNRREVLLDKIRKLQEEKKRLEYERTRVEREVNVLLRETGRSESELLKDYVSKEEVQRLLKERSNLQSKKAELTAMIESIRGTLLSIAGGAESDALRKRYEELRRMKAEVEAEYQKSYRSFIERFRENLEKMFEIASDAGIKIKHFDPRSLRFERQGHTYSKSERLILASSFVLATAKTLRDLGYPVPYVVIDLLSPLDSRYERALFEMSRSTPAKVVILVTHNEHMIRPL